MCLHFVHPGHHSPTVVTCIMNTFLPEKFVPSWGVHSLCWVKLWAIFFLWPPIKSKKHMVQFSVRHAGSKALCRCHSNIWTPVHVIRPIRNMAQQNALIHAGQTSYRMLNCTECLPLLSHTRHPIQHYPAQQNASNTAAVVACRTLYWVHVMQSPTSWQQVRDVTGLPTRARLPRLR